MPDDLTLAFPPTRRVIPLEDARDWFKTAVRELERGDAAAAVHAVYTGLRHADDALAELIPQLVPRED